jgi:hypothetical protein
MNVLKEFFTRDIPAIRRHIEQIEHEENCSDYERNINLCALFEELHDAYTNKKDFDEQEAKDIDDKRLAHKLAALEIKKKNKEIEGIETEIKRKLDANNSKKAEKYIALIPLYERLIELDPNNATYHRKKNKLEKLKLRTEVQDQIIELEKVNNKEGRLKAYRTLQTTYETEEYRTRYTPIIETLAQEIAEEEQQRDEELLRLALYTEVQGKIAMLEHGDANISTQEQQLQLIVLLEESISRGQEITTYIEKAKADKIKLNTLYAEALVEIKAENEKTAQNEQKLKERYQKVQGDKLAVASNKSLPELKRKMQLACLFDSSAEVWYEYPRFANAEDDWKKARSLRYEALALAQSKATKNSAAEKELLALLAPKID